MHRASGKDSSSDRAGQAVRLPASLTRSREHPRSPARNPRAGLAQREARYIAAACRARARSVCRYCPRARRGSPWPQRQNRTASRRRRRRRPARRSEVPASFASPHVCPFAMVDGAMIFEKARFEIGRNLRRAIPVDVGNQTRGVREKVLGVEIEDSRQPDLAFGVLDPDVSRIPDEGACGRIKLPIEGGRVERDTWKSRAADDHAIEGEVNSLVAERANDVIFEFGERD